MMFREGQAHSPTNSLNTKICHLSKQRILYIQFSALVKSNARMKKLVKKSYLFYSIGVSYKTTATVFAVA